MQHIRISRPAARRLELYIDFDGTVAPVDTVDALLEAYGEPVWQDIEAAWVAGRIGSRDAMAAQVAVIRASEAELDAFADQIDIDPTFPKFVRRSIELGLPMTIVSDGLDRVVRRILRRHNLELPIRANHLVYAGDKTWRLEFPFSRETCSSGHCKCASFAEEGRDRILIGDGRSDYCAAASADFVFAKSRLATYCKDNKIAFRSFRTFGQVLPHIEALAANAYKVDVMAAQGVPNA